MDSHADARPVVVTADEKGVIGVVFVTTRGAVFAPPDEETNQTSRVHRPVAAATRVMTARYALPE